MRCDHFLFTRSDNSIVCSKCKQEWFPLATGGFVGSKVPIRVDSNIPPDEVKLRDERSGDEVTMRVSSDTTKDGDDSADVMYCQPERDYYTKQEIDDRVEAVADILARLAIGPSAWSKEEQAILEFRSRFLS